jgi:hypothetical protein
MTFKSHGRISGLFVLISISLLGIQPQDTFGQDENNYLVSAEELGAVSSDLIVFGLIAAGVYQPDMTINDVTIYKLTYNTVDVFGNPTVASGAIYMPQSGADSIPMISYQHGTVMDREEVPSRRSDDPAGLFYAGNGYITTMPDYLGLGDNPGLHPYLHWESEATATIDLIRAAREFLHDSLLIRDHQLFITGYSQGGHATMAVHKYIHVNNLKSEFNLTASAPMSGSYPLSYAQFDHIFSEDSTYSGSYYIPYIISSFQYVYGNLYTDHSEYYDPPYDSIFAAWEMSGNFFEDYPMGSLPKNFYEFMQDSVMDNLLEDFNHPLRIALRKNDLHNWAPQEPVRLIYCGMDDVVPPSCAITTRDTMHMLGAPDVLAVSAGAEYNHGSCALPAFLYAKDWFDSFLADQAVFARDIPVDPLIRLYPNPVNTLLTVETGSNGRTFIQIHSVNGQLVYSGDSEKDTYQIDISSLRKGIYFITIRSGRLVTTRKVVKY